MLLDNFDTKKRKFLELFRKNMGIVSATCEAMNISRQTYYDWLKSDDEFKKSCEDIKETQIDFAESSLLKQIKDGNATSTIFYLKTQGKSRGYIERQEIDYNLVPKWVEKNPFDDEDDSVQEDSEPC